jgi:predicted membrane protein
MEQSVEKKFKQHSNAKRLVFGVLIMCLGAVLLTNNLGLLPWELKNIIFSLPMLAIAIGLLSLSGKNSFTGIILIFIGIFFLIPEIFTFTFGFTHLFWPVLLIAIGLVIIFRHSFGIAGHMHAVRIKDAFSEKKTSDDCIEEVNIFGGSKQRFMSQNFKGGRITSIFGGSELDLTQSKLAEGTNILELVCIFGGSSIIVPPDWHIRSEVVSILGGFADKRHINTNTASKEKDRELIIKGVAILGGGEVKSY